MSKEQILGLVRQILTVVFTVFAAKWFQDGQLTEGIIASVLGAITTIWGIADKSLRGLSAWASAGRHVLSIGAGLIFVFAPGNKILIDVVAAIIAVLTALASNSANKT